MLGIMIGIAAGVANDRTREDCWEHSLQLTGSLFNGKRGLVRENNSIQREP